MSFSELHLLSPIIFAPALGALIIALMPGSEKSVIKGFAFFWTLLVFLISLLILVWFDQSSPYYQFEEKALWIKQLGVYYHVGIDGISLWLVLLTTFLTPLVALSAYKAVDNRAKDYMMYMLVLETGMLGAFLALDVFLFYVFWEVMLIPMYFIIGVFGGERRIYATLKFVLFTMVGSLLMLVGILYLYFRHNQQFGFYSGDLTDLARLVPHLAFSEQTWLFLAFGLAFAVKVPMWPVHTWLPDAHTEAPTGGSVILAGVLLKMGVFGFLRFAIPLFPLATNAALPFIAGLAVFGIIFGALVSIAQKDVKRLIAYSSVSHMGFVMLGLAGMALVSLEGAVYQSLNHGISTGALFLLVGVIYERRHTRLISEYGGLAAVMPAYAAVFLVAALSSAGLPLLNGFVGEFLIMTGAFASKSLYGGKVFAAIASSGVILAAVYLLWMYRRVFFGPIKNDANKNLPDLSLREWGYLLPLVIMMFVMGLAPNLFLKPMEKSVQKLAYDYNLALKNAGGTSFAWSVGADLEILKLNVPSKEAALKMKADADAKSKAEKDASKKARYKTKVFYMPDGSNEMKEMKIEPVDDDAAKPPAGRITPQPRLKYLEIKPHTTGGSGGKEAKP